MAAHLLREARKDLHLFTTKASTCTLNVSLESTYLFITNISFPLPSDEATIRLVHHRIGRCMEASDTVLYYTILYYT